MNSIYIMGIFDWIGDKIVDQIASLLYTIFLMLNSAIYSAISYIYNIFLTLAGGGSIFDETRISEMVGRIYIIIGVVILFIVAYSLLKTMINPDESLKGKKSPVNIIKDIIIAVVLIAFVPTIFNFAFEFQNSLLIENTIGKIIAGNKTGSTSSQETIMDGGYNIAEGVWQAFIYVNPDGDSDGVAFCKDITEEETLKTSSGEDCKPVMVNSSTSFGNLWKQARVNKSFTNIKTIVPSVIDGKINYIFLLDTVAGIFVLFVLISYCLDMALRLVKLAVYELIAPLPILSRIIPNDQTSKVFNNWVKACLTTFAEVFIRIAILYFAVLIIATVGSSITRIFDGGIINFNSSSSLFLTKSIAKALVIVGIILFVKQAPDIIKEITGLDSSKFNVIGSALRGMSTVGALATGAVKGFNASEGSGLNKFKNGVTSSLKSAFNAAGKENKSIKDLKSNTHSAVDEVISKQRKKQAAKLARQQEVDAFREKHPNNILPGPLYKAATRAGSYLSDDLKPSIQDWAGVGAFDSAKVTRTKELADKIESQFSALEGTWKKNQSYMDAKSEADKADNLKNSMEKFIAEQMNNGLTQAQAEAAAENQYGVKYETIKQDLERAKAARDGFARAEHKKKADLIASAAREMQLAQAQYSDIKIEHDAVLDRAKNAQERTALEDAFKAYKNLSDKATFEQLQKDLQSDDDTTYGRAKTFIDYLDNTKKEAQKIKNDAIYAENAKGAAKKKEDK